MKSRMMMLFSMTVALGLLFALVVTAQGPNGPGDPQRGGQYPSPTSDRQTYEPGVFPRLTLRSTLQSRDATAPTLDLGKPGLSFRYMQTFGVAEQAYIADAQHLNAPTGIFMDDSDNLYVVEERGARVLKFNSAGSNVLTIGIAGLRVADSDSFESPVDVIADSSGSIWVVDRGPDRVVQYDTSGTYQQQLGETWTSGTDNAHFNDPYGVALDSAGRLYVADTQNHRIQVYTTTITGTLVFSVTIGETGVSGADNDHFDQPHHIAIDDNDHLYVADAGNDRVQIFDSTHVYVATIGVSGESGSDNAHFNWPTGVHVGSGRIYVADRENWRVQIFDQATRSYQGTIGTGWGWGDNQFAWPLDVTTDSAGNVYVADHVNHRIQKFDNSGSYIDTMGVTRTPYLTDGYHYNHPRVAVDSADNIIILEEDGQRLVKLDSNGVFQWSVGTPGVDGDDNAHFSWPHGVAVGSNGYIYVADGNNRVQIYDGNGTYYATLGTGWGTGDYEFKWPTGIAVDDTGYIYVSDAENHRVQIYDNSRAFVGRIGVTGQCGSDNAHLCWPIGVEVDSAGNIYIADIANCRVQKFNNSRVYQMTFGITGSCGDSLLEVSAEDVAVDLQGQVYVSGWNDRVQVFDPSGAYLTTIGGASGANTSQFRGASGVDVDSAGNVYVTDFTNSRVQKFAPDVPAWRQVNVNGFGDRWNEVVIALEPFSSQLYAGTANWSDGARVWRTDDGQTWIPVSDPGFSSIYTNTNPAVLDITVFDDQLYAGTGWGGAGAQLWRSPDGSNWQPITTNGFGEADNFGIHAFAVFGGMLYVGTGNHNGAQIWHSSSGGSGTWIKVVTDGLGSPHAYSVTGFAVFQDALYAAVEAEQGGSVQVWRTDNGTDWTAVVTDGFGDASNESTGGFAEFGAFLYLGVRNYTTGGQIWRSGNGTTWTQVMGNGFGDSNNEKVESMFAFENELYAVAGNATTGLEVWRSADALTWEQINLDGFGDSNNRTTVWSVGTGSWNNRLYLGTWNTANGGEVWLYLPNRVHLPLVLRNR